jgi:hypothetical protein
MRRGSPPRARGAADRRAAAAAAVPCDRRLGRPGRGPRRTARHPPGRVRGGRPDRRRSQRPAARAVAPPDRPVLRRRLGAIGPRCDRATKYRPGRRGRNQSVGRRAVDAGGIPPLCRGATMGAGTLGRGRNTRAAARSLHRSGPCAFAFTPVDRHSADRLVAYVGFQREPSVPVASCFGRDPSYHVPNHRGERASPSPWRRRDARVMHGYQRFGGAGALPQMQERGRSRSRACARLDLVRGSSQIRGAAGYRSRRGKQAPCYPRFAGASLGATGYPCRRETTSLAWRRQRRPSAPPPGSRTSLRVGCGE